VALPVVERVEPVALPVVELLELSRGELRSVELEPERCIELSLELRPLARRFDFIMFCLLQSHLHLSSLPIVVSDEEATLRSVVVVDEPEVLVSADDEVLERGIFLSVAEVVSFGIVLSVDEDVDVDEDVLGIDLSVVDVDDDVLGIDLSVEDGGVAVVVSFLVLSCVVLLLGVLELGFDRSWVWANAAGAARARARIDVAASFIGASRRVHCWTITVATTRPRDNARPLGGHVLRTGGRAPEAQAPPRRAAPWFARLSERRARPRSSSRSRRCAWRSGS
jgi:hypothetical protein